MYTYKLKIMIRRDSHDVEAQIDNMIERRIGVMLARQKGRSKGRMNELSTKETCAK